MADDFSMEDGGNLEKIVKIPWNVSPLTDAIRKGENASVRLENAADDSMYDNIIIEYDAKDTPICASHGTCYDEITFRLKCKKRGNTDYEPQLTITIGNHAEAGIIKAEATIGNTAINFSGQREEIVRKQLEPYGAILQTLPEGLHPVHVLSNFLETVWDTYARMYPNSVK